MKTIKITLLTGCTLGFVLCVSSAVLFLISDKLCDNKKTKYETVAKIDNISFMLLKCGIVLLMVTTLSLVPIGVFKLL